jgi:diaminopropionate ammonia-lyase
VRAFLNPSVDRTEAFRGLFTDDEHREVQAYFTAHPELSRSPLRTLPSLAKAVGVRRIDAKDETERFGLSAFKIVGVRYAVHRLGDDAVRPGLVCATAGNHGRAVARVAHQKSVPCTVFIPFARQVTGPERRTRTARVASMASDGATVVEVDGTYEDAVSQAAEYGRKTGATIVSDTSWDGYEQIPRWIMAGYTRIFDEARSQWDAPPDVVLIQGGVGGLVCAAASWFSWHLGARRPFLIACEPENAACLFESARAGRLTQLEGSLDTIMAGLRCAQPSPVAWPAIARGIDAFVTVDDDQVLAAMATLAEAAAPERIDAGASGACGAAALAVLGSAPELADLRDACRLDRSTRALIVITEGA